MPTVEVPNQHVDHTAHQIAEIAHAMQTVERLWADLCELRVEYQIAKHRLERLVSEARHG